MRELKGFSKVRLQPHETRHVTLKLSERSFAYFDVGSHGWKTDAGQYMIQVGTSSEQIILEKPVTLN
jgi:beta-glucosidase